MGASSQKKIIVVIGPGRSGTSAVTRGLKVLGVDLGDNLMAPKAGVNDKGFWEDQDIYALNNEIYKEIKHDWHNLVPVDFAAISLVSLAPLKLRAIEILRGKLKSTDLFGMKDPQITRLLPFWRDVFTHLAADAGYVIVCRNPLSVARSLSKYTGFSLEKCYLLWFEHTLASLVDTDGGKRLVVNYDSLMASPTDQLERIRIAMALRNDHNDDGFFEYQSQFLDSELRHTEYQIDDLKLDSAIPPKVVVLYELMVRLAADSLSIDSKKAIAEIKRLQLLHRDDFSVLKYAQDCELKVSMATAVLVTREDQILQLNHVVAERDLVIGNLGQTVKSVLLDRDSQQAGYQQTQFAYTQLSAERDEQVARLDQAISSLVIDRDARKVGQEQLQLAYTQLSTERDDQIARMNQAVESLIIDRDSQRAGLEQAQLRHLQLSTERDEQIARMDQVIASLIIDRDAQKAGLQQAQLAYAQLMAERDGQILSMDQSYKSLVNGLDSMKAELTQAQLAHEQLSTERDEVLARMDRDIASLVSACNVHKTELEQAHLAYARLTVERDEQTARLDQTIASLAIDRDAQKAELAQAHITYAQRLTEQDEQIARLNQSASVREQIVITACVENEKLMKELLNVYESRSWRFTSPLRKLVGVAKSIVGLRRADTNKYEKQTVTTFGGAEPAHTGNSIPLSSPALLPIPQLANRYRILLVSYYCPTRAHAGGLRILDIYALIKQHRPDVQIDLLTHHRPAIDWSTADLYKIFDHVYLSPTEDLTPITLASLHGGIPPNYDLVDLQFHQSAYHLDAFRKFAHKVIFTPMESQAKVLYLDVAAKFTSGKALGLRRVASLINFAAEEVSFSRKADEVVCVSRADAAFLRSVSGSNRVRGIDTGISQFEFAEALAPGFQPRPAEQRQLKVIFVAYFGSETNVIALKWYLENVHPAIRAKVPGYVLSVVGRGDLSSFGQYRGAGVELIGEVPALAPYISEARVGIAPALGGSGLRGKVNQYAVLGVPCVVSPVSLLGLAYRDGENVLVAETPADFADRCIRLLTDFELNDRLAAAARRLCLARYSWQSKWPKIQAVYGIKDAA
jgi:glycosyltransferase involved in cell wall biosynthesis